jgi:hypothetical protein
MGAVLYKGLAAIGELDSSIREQEQVKAEARKEREDFNRRLDESVKSLREIPDSLAATRNGRILGTSMKLSKEEWNIDQKEMRADKRLKFRREQRAELKGRLVRRAGTLAAVEVALAACVVFLVRRPRVRWPRRSS